MLALFHSGLSPAGANPNPVPAGTWLASSIPPYLNIIGASVASCSSRWVPNAPSRAIRMSTNLPEPDGNIDATPIA